MKKFYRTIGIISLALVLAIGMARMDSATASWTNADGAPPESNVATPVNRLSPDQTRQGGVAVGYADPALADLVNYEVDVEGIFFTKGTYVEGESILEEGSAFVGTIPYNDSASVFVGGKIGVGEDNPTESLYIREGNGLIKINSLASTSNPDIQYGASLCADSSGKVVLCSQTFPVSVTKSVSPVSVCYENVTLTASAGGLSVAPYSYTWSGLDGDATITSGENSSSIVLNVFKSYPLYSYGIDVEVTDSTGASTSQRYGYLGVQDDNLCL